MQTISFKSFLQSGILMEELHPELKDVINSKNSYTSKQSQIAKKIRDLTNRGEKTGIEGNMPKGSSRAYLKEEGHHQIKLDGKDAHIKTGTKIAIKASLDKYHKKGDFGDHSLGELQNKAEGGDYYVNNHHRILTKDHETGEYHTNHDSGIFPPLIDHDDEHHQWTRVGHCRDVGSKEFRDITKTDTHPKGISHGEFCDALDRAHAQDRGTYWERDEKHEKKMEHITDHPLVQKFLDHQRNFGTHPGDYRQRKNMGVFEHPDGSKHIVARDHGFDNVVNDAYTQARKNMIKSKTWIR